MGSHAEQGNQSIAYEDNIVILEKPGGQVVRRNSKEGQQKSE